LDVDTCRHNAYTAGMRTTQYTIRAIPKQLDAFPRSQARLRGKSLNQTVLEYLEQAAKLGMKDQDDDFSWIIGANTLENTSLQTINELKEVDKQKSRI
jgi:hypothetical protein